MHILRAMHISCLYVMNPKSTKIHQNTCYARTDTQVETLTQMHMIVQNWITSVRKSAFSTHNQEPSNLIPIGEIKVSVSSRCGENCAVVITSIILFIMSLRVDSVRDLWCCSMLDESSMDPM